MYRFFLFCLIIVLGLTKATVAQETAATTLILADTLTHNQETGIVTAEGNVEIISGQRTLRADFIEYDQNKDIITAKGHIFMNEPTGEIIFAAFMMVTGDFKQAIIDHIRILFADNSRLVANAGIRVLKRDTLEAYRGTYSPCFLCPENPTAPPLWQLRAERVVHDGTALDMIYRDLFLEFYGIPVLYTPLFSHASPKVKRRSGILIPSFLSSTNLGQVYKLPIYYTITPDFDSTITPWLSSKHGGVLETEFRKQYGFGAWQLRSSIVKTDLIETVNGRDIRKKDRIRGHIDFKGRFNIDEHWRTGTQISLETDDTYRRLFGFSHERFSTNQIYAEGFYGKDYHKYEIIKYNNTRNITDNNRQDDDSPLIFPFYHGQYFIPLPEDNSQFQIDHWLRTIDRNKQGQSSSSQLGSQVRWRKPYIFPIGLLAYFESSLYGDVYYFNSFNNGVTPNKEATLGRMHPQSGLELRYPFINKLDDSQIMITPILGGVLAPNTKRHLKVPNEDSLGFELDEKNVFAFHRLPGVDRFENGSRIFYGSELSVNYGSGQKYALLLGQSYNFSRPEIEINSDVKIEHLSDYVGQLTLSPHPYFDTYYRFNIDHHTRRLRKNEIMSSFGPEYLKFHVSYIKIDNDITLSREEDPEEIVLGMHAKLNDYWSLGLQTNRDLLVDKQLNTQVTLAYLDECFGFSVAFRDSKIRDRDIASDKSALFTISFKNLGEFTYKANFLEDPNTPTTPQIMMQ